MGWWLASKAQATAFKLGKAFLDHTGQTGMPVRNAFVSPYHLLFLFRMLALETSLLLQKGDKLKDAQDIQEGVAVAIDRLRNSYYGKLDELALKAQDAAFKDDAIIRKANDDFNLWRSAVSGDDTSKAQLNSLIHKHPLFGDKEKRPELRLVGFDLDDTNALGLFILFIDTIPGERGV
jgi:hypothetical protein